mmetsp:Transcript_31053/g.30505  ORF Transcript_31053/g.30505 Transcript_31053/m.30505 type:complete len:180 (+) Transcript_31053:336-875(+)
MYKVSFSSLWIYWAVIVSSFLSGVGSALMWVSQQKYYADCAQADSKGFFFGLFWFTYSISQILGYLLSSEVLLYFESQLQLFIVMMGFSGVASFFFVTLPTPTMEKQAKDLFHDQIDDELSILTQPSPCSEVEPKEQVCYSSITQHSETSINSFKKDVKHSFFSIIKLLRSKRMLTLVP